MTGSSRWAYWVATVIGLLLIVSPFVFATNVGSTEAWTAYILGGGVALVGLAQLVFPDFRYGDFIQFVLAVVVFFSPWLIGFGAVGAMAWTAWILGIALGLVVMVRYLVGTGRPVAPTT